MLCEFVGLGFAALCWPLRWTQDAEILRWYHTAGSGL